MFFIVYLLMLIISLFNLFIRGCNHQNTSHNICRVVEMLEPVPASQAAGGETPRTDGQSIKRLTHIHKHILFIYFNYLFYSQLLYLFLTILVSLEMN